ncbi:MAG: DNA polymerase III subunit delta [Prevotella sp.]|nr:DNA polymerase III subunit delta [Prevotella sp.]MBQ6730217.1 DNA polymerase III subunit delta [Bacteroidales bacterium]
MAEKKQTATYEGIMKSLAEGVFSPIYILMGEESYFIDKITDYIAQHALSEEERDFNQTVCFGADVTSGQVADMARRFPMMAERQVVIVKEAQNIKNWDRLEQYFEKPQPSTVLVIAYKNGTIDGRKKILAKAQAAGGVVFESKKKRDHELAGFIEGYLKTQKATIENKACQMVADHIGADLSRLVSELDKVVLSLPEDNRRITPEIVEEQIGVSKEYNGYELRGAIASKDILKVNRILKYFDSNPKSGSSFMLIPLLFSYFQNLMLAHYAPQKNNENAVAQFLDLRGGWAAREYIQGMRNYSGLKTMQIIQKIRETDAKSKGLDNPNTPVGDLLKELIFFILH